MYVQLLHIPVLLLAFVYIVFADEQKQNTEAENCKSSEDTITTAQIPPLKEGKFLCNSRPRLNTGELITNVTNTITNSSGSSDSSKETPSSSKKPIAKTSRSLPRMYYMTYNPSTDQDDQWNLR